jgi:type IX secretion system PorP/SprF family membrane protein
MRIKFYILSLIIWGCVKTNAQNFPIFSQYVSNGLIINPAYTGSREVLSISMLYRDQMVGFDGSPKYQTLSAHAPLKNDNIGLGILFLNESSGPMRNSHLYTSYSYRLRLGSGKLSFGLKAGINYGQYNWKNVYLNNSQDPAFLKSDITYVLPNFGAGVYYYSSKYFAGFSIPYFLSYRDNASHDGFEFYNDFKNYTFLITTGYLFRISRDFKIKPTALIKYYTYSKEQFDLNLNIILLNDRLWLGSAYRLDEAYSGSFEVQLNPQFRIGYAFEFAGKTAESYNYTSHDITLRYEFSYKIKAFNPRYF